MEQDRKPELTSNKETNKEDISCFANGDELSHPQSRAERDEHTYTCFSFHLYSHVAQHPKPGNETAHSGLGLTYRVNPYSQGKSFTGMPKGQPDQ